MDLIIQQPIPYKSLDFLQQYLRAYFTLTGEQKWRRFRLLFFLLTLKSAHHLLLSVHEPPTTTLKLLGNDLFRLTHLPPATNLVAVGTLAISGYYLYLIYFETMHTAMDFFAEVMDDRRRTTTFLISRYMPGKRGQTVSQYLKQYCFVVLIALQVFILAIDFFVLMSQFYGIRAVLRLPLLSPAALVATLIVTELNMLTLYTALYIFSLSHMLLAMLGFTLMKAVSVLLGQLQQLLLIARRKRRKNLVTSSSRRFRREYTRVVIFFSRNNGYTAKSLLPMLLVNCPSTALLISTLLTSSSSSSLQQALKVTDFIRIFLVHLLLSNLNGHLRALARRYISLAFTGDHCGVQLYKQKTKHPQRERLLSCLFQERFHSRKPTGFTYFTFGYLSRFNFVKYLLFYSELFMFVYQTGF
ncbi:hypothetical protein TYRP_007774 [Tyrophagus putrescentiae]|nr:hypothetical protein TYRP_007774 [Tyrophagus putrescentiae]